MPKSRRGDRCDDDVRDMLRLFVRQQVTRARNCDHGRLRARLERPALVVGQAAVTFLRVHYPRRLARIAQSRRRFGVPAEVAGILVQEVSHHPWLVAAEVGGEFGPALGGSGTDFSIIPVMLSRAADGSAPRTEPSRTMARKNAASSLLDMLMPSRTVGPANTPDATI